MKIVSPVSGRIKNVTELNDGVFSKNMMGVGFYVIGDDREVISPINGKVTFIADTLHAVVIENENYSVMVHVGLDTCHMKGAPFTVQVKEDQNVVAGQPLLKVDRKLIKAKGYDGSVIVILMENKDQSLFSKLPFMVKAGKVILELKV